MTLCRLVYRRFTLAISSLLWFSAVVLSVVCYMLCKAVSCMQCLMISTIPLYSMYTSMIDSDAPLPVASAQNQGNDSEINTSKRKRSLLKRKESQIAAADAIRKTQIKSINQHYQFEVRKAEGNLTLIWHRSLFVSLSLSSLSHSISPAISYIYFAFFTAQFGLDLDYCENNALCDANKEERKGEALQATSLTNASLIRFSMTNNVLALKLQDDAIR